MVKMGFKKTHFTIFTLMAGFDVGVVEFIGSAMELTFRCKVAANLLLVEN